MNNQLASLQLSPDLIKPIIETHIKGAIQAILGDPNDVVKVVVDKILNTNVNEQGVVSRYDGENKHNYIDVIFRNTINAVAKEEIQKWATENSEKVRIEIQRQISTKKGVESFARAVVEGMLKCTSSAYRVNVDMKFENSSDK